MIELLIIAIYLGVGGFCAQICVGLARGSCTRKGGHDYTCDHGGWYFTALLGFFLPMIMVGMLVAKRSGLDLTEKERPNPKKWLAPTSVPRQINYAAF